MLLQLSQTECEKVAGGGLLAGATCRKKASCHDLLNYNSRETSRRELEPDCADSQKKKTVAKQ